MPARKSSPREPARDQRIHNEIIVGPYGPEEVAMGWYYYLERVFHFPFPARCRAARAISPLCRDERVTVTGMAPETECEHEMFVQIKWQERTLAVPLAQLEVRGVRAVDAATREASGDGKRSGKPSIRGLGITVEDVLSYLASGMSEADIVADFPDLEREDFLAVFGFAADRERRLLTDPAA